MCGNILSKKKEIFFLMVTVILVQEIIQHSLITCEFVSTVLVSLGIIVANSPALPDAEEAQRGSSLPLSLCIY